MKSKSIFLSLVVLLCSFQSATVLAQQVDDAHLVAACDELLAGQFHTGEPGATVLIARNGQIVYEKAFGMANLELQVPMQINNVFRIGSITKQFTAVAILQLMEQGKLSLQDEITKFIPNYPTQGSRITIEHLLTHTSGIQDYAKIRDTTQRGVLDFTPGQMIEYFENRPMRFAPGTKWEYSNSNYVLLGYIIERLTGETYQEYLESHILGAAGMNHSSYASDTRIIKDRADGYRRGDHGFENAQYLSMTQPYAAGAIQSTVEDLFMWHQAVYTGKLISKASVEKALTRYVLSNGDTTNYGYGLRFGYIQDSPSIWHGGMVNGYIAMEMYLPNEDVFVSVLSNCECNSPEDITAKLAAIAIRQPYDYKAVVLSDSILADYTGVYENAKGLQQVITVSEHQLYVGSGRGPKAKVIAVAQDKFIPDKDELTRLDFARGDRGEVEKLLTKSRSGIGAWHKTNKPIPSTEGIELSEQTIEAYVGEYEIAPDFSFTVTKDHSRLFVKATGQEAFEIFAESESKFFLKVNDAQLDFVRDDLGHVTKAILTQAGRTTDAKKVK